MTILFTWQKFYWYLYYFKCNLKLFKQRLSFLLMVYKYIEIVGTSDTNITDAVNNAFKEASKTIKNIQWGELGKVTFRVNGEQKIEYQAEVKIGFKIERNDNPV